MEHVPDNAHLSLLLSFAEFSFLLSLPPGKACPVADESFRFFPALEFLIFHVEHLNVLE